MQSPASLLQLGAALPLYHFTIRSASIVLLSFKSACKQKNSQAQKRLGVLVPVVGVEPTRVVSTRDFESPSSAIPTHRPVLFCPPRRVRLLYPIPQTKSRCDLVFRTNFRRAARAGKTERLFQLIPEKPAPPTNLLPLLCISCVFSRRVFRKNTLQMRCKKLLYKRALVYFRINWPVRIHSKRKG